MVQVTYGEHQAGVAVAVPSGTVRFLLTDIEGVGGLVEGGAGGDAGCVGTSRCDRAPGKLAVVVAAQDGAADD